MLAAATSQASNYVDSNHPAIAELAAKLTKAHLNTVDKAIALHDFVRDEVPFGFSGKFYDQRASEVLRSGRGFCNTKSTLLAALLSAVDIPARQHFVEINADILDGFIDPGTTFVDHSFLEIYLEGKWLKVDSYIVDRRLAEVARQRLRDENKVIGYGVHVNGVSDWDGRSHAFSQFLNDGAHTALAGKDYGIVQDIGVFYAEAPRNNRLTGFTRLAFPLFAATANRRIERLRGNR